MNVNHGDIVRAVYDTQPAAKSLSGALAFVLRVLAALPPTERAGLLLKPAGENIIEYNGTGQFVSAGRICYPDGQLYKVLTDVPTTNGPQWADDGTVDPARYLAVATDPIKEPDKPPVDNLQRIADSLMLIAHTLDTFDAQLSRLEDRATIEARVQLYAEVPKGTLPWPLSGVAGTIVLKKRDPGVPS